MLSLGLNAIAASPISDNLYKDINEQVHMGVNVDQTFQEVGLTQIISQVINTFLGLLGTIFIVLMLLGGYNWMTAQGDESKVEKAKSTIQRAIIGLIIIVSAYSITYTIFKAL